MTKQILIDEDKVKLALKELETWKRFTHGENEHTNKAITALEEALAKQEHGEPVGEMQLSAIYEGMVVPVVSVELPAGTKLYTTPQQRKPLTDEQIYAIQTSASFTWKGFARAIEAAHGIKE